MPESTTERLIECHPPERGQPQQRYVVLYSCCCCCCCCLHTLGGVIGAVIAGNYPPRGTTDKELAARPSTHFVYWMSVLFAFLIGWLGLMLLMLSQRSASRDIFDSISAAFVTSLFLLVILGPVFFLGASAIAAFWLTSVKEMRYDRGYWKSLGTITGCSILGSLIGTGIMILYFVVQMG